MDDKIASSEMGDDGWDPKSYLNIWVGALINFCIHVPGDPSDKDGLVLSIAALGGRTAVHEVGHWLGLRHLWGDDCGDDGVVDTPKQETCIPMVAPLVFELAATTSRMAICTWTIWILQTMLGFCNVYKGSKTKMRALFEPGGPLFYSFIRCIGKPGE
jgi:hypothetical protein